MRTQEEELKRLLRIRRGQQILEEKSGKAVRPYRADGYVNLLNKYGTSQDNSEAYTYAREPIVPDIQFTSMYESNGLFAKIIDAPAEEALKHGFDLGLNDPDLTGFVEDALDALDWEEKAATAIKWARLYGGSIIVMLIDDGGGLEDPLNWRTIKSIDELRVFERAAVQPDYSSLYKYDSGSAHGNRISRFGKPEYYNVLSVYGSFQVHESRCLVFKNGVLPERVTNPIYQLWGIPEYIRISKAIQETITAHQDATKLLERSVQAIYKMKNLAQQLATTKGEEQVLRRLQLIDMARGMLNSIAIDSEGEDYDFRTFQFSGVKDVIDATCNMLSALTTIPQTVLFGRSPAGMNATGESDFESWYNFIERIQKLMLRRNQSDLLDVIFQAGIASGEIDEEPKYKLKFNPLWSLSDTEQASVDKAKADIAMVKAQAAQIYVDMQALDPSEVRKGLAGSEDFNVEELLDGEDGDESFLDDLIVEVGESLEVEEPDTLGGELQPKQTRTVLRQPVPLEMDDLKNSAQTHLTTASPKATIRKSSSAKDGGQGSGNFGHGGRQGQAGGSDGSLSAKDKKELSERFIGQTTSDGVAITGISEHAFTRLGGRAISPGRVDKMIASTDVKSGHTDATRCYDIHGSRMVLDVKSGNVVTVMWRRGKGNK